MMRGAPLTLALLVILPVTVVAQETLCGLKLSDAPLVRGFKLGMTDADLKRKFPSIKIEEPTKYGEAVLNLTFTPADLSFRKGVVNLERSSMVSTQTFPEFAGIAQAGLNLVDGTVFSITVVYDDSVKWRNVDQFAERVSSSLAVPSTWSEDEKVEGVRHLRCRGFWVRAELEGSAGRLRLTDMSSVALVQSRRADKDEQGRRTFKP